MSKLLINEHPLLVLPSLATAIGLNEAIVLQQIHYWISNPALKFEHDGCKWVYNTAKDWQKQFPFFSKNTVIRALDNLRDLGVVRAEKLSKNRGNQTLYYTVNYDNLAKIESQAIDKPFTQNGQINHLPKMGNSFTQNGQISTETTTETTTENPLTPKGGSAKAQALDKAKAVVDLYNEMTKGKFAGVRALDQSRIRAIVKANKFKFDDKAPFSDYNLDAYERYFELALSNPFNCGQNDRGWRANFDYLMRPKTMLTILEAHYA